MKFKELNSSSQIGVEITEVDLSNPLTKEELDAVRNLWVKNSVAIFPNQKLSHDEYNNFAMQFGKFGEESFLKKLPCIFLYKNPTSMVSELFSLNDEGTSGKKLQSASIKFFS